MPKTIKGARLIHKRSNDPNASPTIPTNDDHTTGWLNTDIYIGELFINTSATESKIWFRESSGTTRMATLNSLGKLPKDQLTSNEQNIIDNHTSSGDKNTTVDTDLQYININCESPSINVIGVSNISLSNLETVQSNVYYIGLYMDGEAGCNLTTNITGTGLSITKNIVGNSTAKYGICLMWRGMWIIISDTTN